MKFEDMLNAFVAFLVFILILFTLSVSEDPSSYADVEHELKDYECCPSGTDLSIHANDVLDCIYGEQHTVEGVYSSVPFAVKVYCNTGEVLEY